MNIASLDQLLEHAVLVAEGEASWEGVELMAGCATIPITVYGAGWDGKIDARGAKYIESLQNKLDTYYSAYPNQLPGVAPLLKVEVKDGSNELWALFEPMLREAVSKLSPQDIVDLIKYGLLCATGLWGSVKLGGMLQKDRAHKRETEAQLEKDKLVIEAQMHKESVEAERQQQLAQALTSAVEKMETVVPENREAENFYTQPIRDYVNKLAPEDRLSIAQMPAVKVVQARKFFKARRRPRSQTRWSGCDGVYTCLGLDLEQKVPRLRLQQDGVPATALLGRLSSQESDALINKIKERVEKREMPFRLNLQINAYYNDAGIKWTTVVGVGLRRDKLYPHRLADIPANIVEAFDEASAGPEEDR